MSIEDIENEEFKNILLEIQNNFDTLLKGVYCDVKLYAKYLESFEKLIILLIKGGEKGDKLFDFFGTLENRLISSKSHLRDLEIELISLTVDIEKIRNKDEGIDI